VRLPAVQGIIDPLGHAPEQDPPRR
jgi:hypothetical protein